MSTELEGVFNAIYDGKVPTLWAKKSCSGVQQWTVHMA